MTVSSDMLAAFVKVAEGGSVSRAADELGLGKSAVSKRIAQLETAVGTTLFARSSRRIVLTPAGEAYAEHARRALAEMDAGDERVRALRTELTGCIRLSSTVSWGRQVLARRLPEFLRLHPSLEIELSMADRMVDVAYERIDLALRWSASVPPGLAAEPVADVGFLLVGAPAYLNARGLPARPADLQAHECLGYWREPSDGHWSLAGPEGRVKLDVRGRYRVDNPEAVAEAALLGLGIALLPDYLCRDALADGRLVRVLDAWTPETRFGNHITAVGAPERMRLARNRALLDWLRQAFVAG